MDGDGLAELPFVAKGGGKSVFLEDERKSHADVKKAAGRIESFDFEAARELFEGGS